MECGECGEWGGMLYSGECPQTFWGMFSNMLGNVLKHTAECGQTFRGKSASIPGNVSKHSGECRQIFWGMSPNIKGECRQTLEVVVIFIYSWIGHT